MNRKDTTIAMTSVPGTVAEHRNAPPSHDQLTSPEAILSDGELTPPEMLELLRGLDEYHGRLPAEGYARVADAADLGLPDPAPYSEEVQRAIAELSRLHRESLALSDRGTWVKGTKAPAR